MMVTSVSAISQMTVTLLIRFYSVIDIDEHLYNLFFIPIDPKNDPIYKGLSKAARSWGSSSSASAKNCSVISTLFVT